MTISNHLQSDLIWAYTTTRGRIGYDGLHYVLEDRRKTLKRVSEVEGPFFPRRLASTELTQFFERTYCKLSTIGTSLKLTIYAKGRGGIIDARTRELAEILGIHDPLVEDRHIEENIVRAFPERLTILPGGGLKRIKVETIDYFPIIEEGKIIAQEENIPTRKIFLFRFINRNSVNTHINGNFAIRGLLGSNDGEDLLHGERLWSNYEEVTIFFKRDMSQMDFTLEWRHHGIKKVLLVNVLAEFYIRCPMIPIAIALKHVYRRFTTQSEEAPGQEVALETKIIQLIGIFFPVFY